MPPTNTTADRVMMRLAEEVRDTLYLKGGCDEPELWAEEVAAALSSHGLREAVELTEKGIAHKMTSSDKIYLLHQVQGYHDLLQQILEHLLGAPVPSHDGERKRR